MFLFFGSSSKTNLQYLSILFAPPPPLSLSVSLTPLLSFFSLLLLMVLDNATESFAFSPVFKF